jgi:DNA-binding transcriptional LysR family regulator
MIWDDLRFFLVAARMGSMSRAARELQVDPSTVSRRLGALEELLGAQLFRRGAGGLTLTAEGELIRTHAEDAELAVQGSLRVIRTRTNEPSGTVRISTNEPVAVEILAPAADELRERYPQVSLELESGRQIVNVPRGEADIALRMLRPGKAPGQPSLLARKLAEVPFALYASPNRDPAGLPLIEYSDLAPFKPGEGHPDLPGDRASVRSGCIVTLRALVAAGAGVAVLPCIWGEGGKLAQISAPLLTLHLWAVVHPELRGAPAVSAVLSFLVELFGRQELSRRLQGSYPPAC